MSLQFATERLIDSVWTLSFKWVDNKVEIIGYDRDSEVGYKHEKDLNQVQLVEDENRIVTAVKIKKYEPFCRNFDNAHTFEVVNPQHVFSYSS